MNLTDRYLVDFLYFFTKFLPPDWNEGPPLWKWQISRDVVENALAGHLEDSRHLLVDIHSEMIKKDANLIKAGIRRKVNPGGALHSELNTPKEPPF